MMDNHVEGLYEQYFAATDSSVDSCQYPDLALDSDAQVYLCWQSYRNRHDVIKAAKVVGDQVAPPVTISGEGQALHPRICWFCGKMWVLWCECAGNRWKLMMRSLLGENAGEPVTVSESAGVFFPCAASSEDLLFITWCEQEHGDSRVMMAAFDGSSIVSKRQVSADGQAYRSDICCGSDGELYITYDVFDGSRYDVAACVLTDGAPGKQTIFSCGKGWAASPVMTRTPQGVAVAWYEVAANSCMYYYLTELTVNNGIPQAGEVTEVAQSTVWANYLSIASHGDKTVFCHTQGNRMIVLRDRISGGGWSQVVPLVQNNERYHTQTQRILMDSDDNIYIVYQTANANGHNERNAEIIFGKLRHENLKHFESDEVGSYISVFTRPIESKKTLARHDPKTVREWLDRNGYKDQVLKFGDIHGQSTMSDGTGEMDHYYNYARCGAPRMDFTALTDHDSFPDVITESEWEFMRTTANEFNKDGEFVTLLAYEWTANEYYYDFGHKNAYYRTGDGELFRCTEPEGLTPDRLFASLKRYGAICIPHHPAGIWCGPRSHSTDWDFHDPDVQRVAEVFSRHAPYERYGDISAFTKNQPGDKGRYVQDALARNYRMGLIGGSDSHQLEHGVEGGIMGAFMPTLTRENLFDALYDRLVYATTGAHILVSMLVNGWRMGSEIRIENAQPVRIDFSVLGTASLKSVEIIRDNTVMFIVEPDGAGCDQTMEDTSPVSGSFYYLRVTQKDGHQAWSSPVWVDFYDCSNSKN